MTANDELTAMERSVVLQNVKSQDAQLTVGLENKNYTSVGVQKAVFPVGIPDDRFQVWGNGIFTFDYGMRAIEEFVGKKVRVQFYYNHLGLYFVSYLTKTPQGYAVVVPPDVKRIPEPELISSCDFCAKVSYKSAGKEDVEINCRQDRNFNIFSKPEWGTIEPSLQSTIQKHYERFVYELNPDDSEDISYLIPVCRYLARPIDKERVEGTAKPFDILYMDPKKIILGCESEKVSGLKLDAKYNFAISFAISTSEWIKRTVKTKIIASSVLAGDDFRRCFVCEFDDMKMEDMRYICEKFEVKKFAS